MASPKRTKSTRVAVMLVCTECQSRNYQTTKRRPKPGDAGATDELEIKKFCKQCGRHTLHRASK